MTGTTNAGCRNLEFAIYLLDLYGSPRLAFGDLNACELKSAVYPPGKLSICLLHFYWNKRFAEFSVKTVNETHLISTPDLDFQEHTVFFLVSSAKPDSICFDF